MALPLTLLESVYTSKDGKLTAYQLGKLSTSGKHCLVRLNKSSENGISLTVCDLVSTLYTSKVSKAGAEKGIQPVVIEPGFPLLFDINAQTSKDGKDSDEKKLIETVAAILDGKGVKPGEIRFMSLDLLCIPPAGFKAKAIKVAIEDNDDEENYFYVGPVLSTVDDIQEIVEKWGYSPQGWSEAYALIAGNTFVEGKAYAPKKSFKELLMERVTDIEALTPEEKIRICACVKGYHDDEESAWNSLVNSWLTSI